MRWRRDRRSVPALTPRELATSWQLVSLLLDYPTEELVGRVPLLTDALGSAPGVVADALQPYLAELQSGDLAAVQADYVDTFDVTRRCALHLTYYTCGDTRRRGVALVQVKQAYRAAGVELDRDDELPDYLPVVLEFGAAHDLDAAWRLLNDYRVGIELLHRALRDRGSRWLGVVEALRLTLPELDGSDERALAALVAQGPPEEQVGIELDPYAIDPRLNPRPEPFDTPTRPAPADLGPTIPVGAPR
jgi:nitrate reductase delta subunit